MNMTSQSRMIAALAALAALAGLPPGAAAQEISTQALYACAQTGDDAARLACYDAAVGRLKAAEEAGEITTVTREQVETVQRESFGFAIPSLPSIAMPRLGGGDGSGEIETLSYGVTELEKTSLGKAIVTLENGQVWRQTDTTRTPRRAGQAEIKRAAFGSFTIKLDNNPPFRAERVR